MTLLPYKWWETLLFTQLTIDIGQFQEDRSENLGFFLNAVFLIFS